MFSLEYAQLLTQGKDLEAEAITGTEESAEAKWSVKVYFCFESD